MLTKSSPKCPKVAKKLAIAVLFRNSCFSHYPFKSPNFWATFVMQFVATKVKIAEFGLTGHEPHPISSGDIRPEIFLRLLLTSTPSTNQSTDSN